MIYEINHVGIKTFDIEASIEFYVSLLGGTIVRDAKSTDGRSRFVYVQLERGIVELITVASEADQGFAHIALLLDSDCLDASYEKLSGEGVHFTVLPKVAGSGDGRLAFLSDPGGVIFELIERKSTPRKKLDYNENIIKFDYTVIGAGEHKNECLDFYRGSLELIEGEGDICGLRKESILVKPEDGGIEYLSFTCKGIKRLQTMLEENGIKTEDDDAGFFAIAPSREKLYFHE